MSKKHISKIEYESDSDDEIKDDENKKMKDDKNKKIKQVKKVKSAKKKTPKKKYADPETEFSDDNRKDFYSFLDGKIKAELFLKDVMKLHNHQWSSYSYNFIASKKTCRNDCFYCYMKPMRSRMKKTMDDIEDLFVCNKEKVDKGWRESNDETKRVYMFPSSHDIFPENVDDYITIAKKMLEAGNKIICVTKPRIKCIKTICEELSDYKETFMFRFTITTSNNATIKLMEGNSTMFEERLECLKYAYQCGYDTSISMEPLLEDPTNVIQQCADYVTKSIWIGTMSSMDVLRKNQPEEIQKEFDRLDKLYSKKSLTDMVKKFRDNKKVYWKTSVMRICTEE